MVIELKEILNGSKDIENIIADKGCELLVNKWKLLKEEIDENDDLIAIELVLNLLLLSNRRGVLNLKSLLTNRLKNKRDISFRNRVDLKLLANNINYYCDLVKRETN